MRQYWKLASVGAVATALIMIVGCGSGTNETPAPANGTTPNPTPSVAPKGEPVNEVAAERAKLTAADRELVDAQEWCVITDARLGSMGVPLKLDIKGQPVFVCCKACRKEAEADPEKTLAKAKELKAKAKAEKAPKP